MLDRLADHITDTVYLQNALKYLCSVQSLLKILAQTPHSNFIIGF